MAAAFLVGSAWPIVVTIFAPETIGSHGGVYSDAARAMVTGGNPWVVGPPAAVFGGPPSMLVPFVPTAFVGWDAARFVWVALDLVVATWALRRLQLPAYWLLFPPLFIAISIGHPEVLVLALITVKHPIGGLAMLIKPYAAFPFLAERRWMAFSLAAVVGAVTLLVLPWRLFFDQLPEIGATLARQNVGDSVFGQPIPMAVGIICLIVLGPRRALWLGVPVIWPYAQPIYKTMTVPMLSPIIAIAWAIPIQGATVSGIVIEAALLLAARRRTLGSLLRSGLTVRAITPGVKPVNLPTPAVQGATVQ